MNEMSMSDIISMGSLIVAMVAIITSYLFSRQLLKAEKLHERRIDLLEELFKQLLKLKDKLNYFKECDGYGNEEEVISNRETAVVEICGLLCEIRNKLGFVSLYFTDDDKVIKSIDRLFVNENKDNDKAILENPIFLQYVLLKQKKEKLITIINEASIISEEDCLNDEYINSNLETVNSMIDKICEVDEDYILNFVENSLNIIEDIEKEYKKIIAI